MVIQLPTTVHIPSYEEWRNAIRKAPGPGEPYPGSDSIEAYEKEMTARQEQQREILRKARGVQTDDELSDVDKAFLAGRDSKIDSEIKKYGGKPRAQKPPKEQPVKEQPAKEQPTVPPVPKAIEERRRTREALPGLPGEQPEPGELHKILKVPRGQAISPGAFQAGLNGQYGSRATDLSMFSLRGLARKKRSPFSLAK